MAWAKKPSEPSFARKSSANDIVVDIIEKAASSSIFSPLTSSLLWSCLELVNRGTIHCFLETSVLVFSLESLIAYYLLFTSKK